MPRFAIKAYDSLYGGLHGMCSQSVEEFKNKSEAIQYAVQESMDVIVSYANIYEELDRDVEELTTPDMTDRDIYDLREEIYYEDTDYEIYLINEEKAAGLSTVNLDELFYDLEDEFIERYCCPND